MRGDLDGQMVMFPELEPMPDADKRMLRAAGRETADDGCPLPLPNKPTCTIGEAARATGISERQLQYWVADGTLLAVDSSRRPVRSGGGGQGLRRWRIVVRRAEGFDTPEAKAFLTLAEVLRKGSNIEAV